MLESFEIRNFRAFSHLFIQRLRRVNLIVGKNNVGKTSLLEALRFYAMRSPTALREHLVDHDELARPARSSEIRLDLPSLFHGRGHGPSEARFGPVNQPERALALHLVKMERVEESDGGFDYLEYDNHGGPPEGEIVPVVIIQRGDARLRVSPEVTRRAVGLDKYVGPAVIPARGVRSSDLSQWWDEIALTDGESRVSEAMHLIAPIERISTREDPLSRGGRVFIARLQDQNTPVPLRSLGGGPSRVFQILLALEYSRHAQTEQATAFGDSPDEAPWKPGGLLLIDEFENGVHHSLQADLWRTVFQLARLHGIQVFATTHSWNCLEGFAKAAGDDEENDGLAVRLEKVEGEEQTGAVIIDGEDLPIVVRDSIEVR